MSTEMVGFNPEAQASATYQAESKNRLYTLSGTYANFQLLTERKVEWVEINYLQDRTSSVTKRAHAIAAECDLQALQNAPYGERISFVLGWEPRPDAFEGKNFVPVGAMVLGSTLIYRLKGFSYEQYVDEEYKCHMVEKQRRLLDDVGIKIQWKPK